jgi:hypothetical protein
MGRIAQTRRGVRMGKGKPHPEVSYRLNWDSTREDGNLGEPLRIQILQTHSGDTM